MCRKAEVDDGLIVATPSIEREEELDNIRSPKSLISSTLTMKRRPPAAEQRPTPSRPGG
jgi:hypothetical protein